jgi:hypothetical protein
VGSGRKLAERCRSRRGTPARPFPEPTTPSRTSTRGPVNQRSPFRSGRSALGGLGRS